MATWEGETPYPSFEKSDRPGATFEEHARWLRLVQRRQAGAIVRGLCVADGFGFKMAREVMDREVRAEGQGR